LTAWLASGAWLQEFDACRRVLGFLSSGPGHLLTPTLDQVRLDQVRLTTGGARTCECTVFYGPCHNALVQGKGCTNSVQRTGQAFRKRVPVCDECMVSGAVRCGGRPAALADARSPWRGLARRLRPNQTAALTLACSIAGMS
jgi:hypothetical protein